MKKILSLALVLAMMVSTAALTACGEDSKSTSGASTSSSSIPPAVSSSEPEQSQTTPTKTEAPQEDVMTSIPLKFTKYETVSSDQDPTASEGVITAWDRWATTDYISVSDYYGLYYELAAHPYLMSVSFYDKDHNYLEGVSTKAICNAHAIGNVIRPEQAEYARFITFIGSGSNEAFILPYVGGFESKESYEAYLNAHPFAGLEIACIGDSLTEGDMGKTPGVANIIFRNYPYFLSKALSCPVHNMGRCGHTGISARDQFRQGGFDISTSDVILVMLGTNAGLKSSAGQYAAYRELISLLEKNKKEGAVIVLVTPPHASAIKPQVSDVTLRGLIEAAETVRAFAKANGYPLIDTQDSGPITEDMENIYQPNDGLHFSEAGYHALADYVAEQLRQILSR